MENKLCYKCMEKWEGYWEPGMRRSDYSPWLHCHHEPKERPKCWCEDNSTMKIERYRGFNWEPFKVNFCPQCGKGMEKEQPEKGE
jgi:hypothetical protein